MLTKDKINFCFINVATTVVFDTDRVSFPLEHSYCNRPLLTSFTSTLPVLAT